jgi:pSer/pThr/pTyr-binding forkhead associated (FHA) protein
MFDIEIPQNDNYIILETLDQIKDNNNYKSIHVITLNDENYIIGRGHECDIRLNDISVSRLHSLIHFDMIRKLLLIRDLKSKFGTLILIKKPINILNKYLRIQIGRTYIETKLVKEEEVKEYFKENEKGLILFGNISNDNLTTDSDSNISYIFS